MTHNFCAAAAGNTTRNALGPGARAKCTPGADAAEVLRCTEAAATKVGALLLALK